MAITSTIKRLKEQCKKMKHYEQKMDSISWGMQEGILITGLEAESIVNLIQSVKTIIKISDRNHEAWYGAKEELKNLTN